MGGLSLALGFAYGGVSLAMCVLLMGGWPHLVFAYGWGF